MAATLFPSRADTSPNLPIIYPRNLISDLDFGDNRYPSLMPTARRASTLGNDVARAGMQPELSPIRHPTELSVPLGDAQSHSDLHVPGTGQSDMQSIKSQSQEPSRSQVSYALPQGASRRVVERYSLEDNQPSSSRGPEDTTLSTAMNSPRPLDSIPFTSSPRHPSAPAGPSAIPPAIVPLSASPGYVPPISSRNRAFPQQPTYITQTATPKPVNPVYSPRPPQEEVCLECAMRDQDMADVDVTTPGVWDRESDVLYEELKAREREEELTGVIQSDEPPRPKSKGGKLTEQNVKIWLSINPREPASRQNTLHTYVTSQRKLIEAEVLAHARAMQEAKQLDNRMRDTYSSLRRSAYDSGATAAPMDDTGGVRIRPPRSPSTPSNPLHDRTHSREVTLLENGMIVEHVDVRKEEREARERRRKEERRARKSSRSSVIDMSSVMSTPSLPTHADSGVGLKPYSRYSQGSPARPMSVLTTPMDRPEFPRAQSQASFSDVHSLGSSSPRRSRFFGFSNFKDGWASRDSLAPSAMMSGSMMDMHVALQKENSDAARYGLGESSRRSQLWSAADLLQPTTSRLSNQSEPKPKKKKGLAKIWGIVTRSSRNDSKRQTESSGRTDDEPLAPPPPLTYLLSREGRHVSTPTLSSPTMKMTMSPVALSPTSASSTHLPTPSSSRPSGSGSDSDTAIVRQPSAHYDDDQRNPEERMSKNISSMTSEPDMRRRMSRSPSSSPHHTPTLLTVHTNNTTPGANLTREKSLPPIPGDMRRQRSSEQRLAADSRPQTMYTFDSRPSPIGGSPAHDFLPPQAPFRNGDVRRQSFGGLTTRPNLDVQLARNQGSTPRSSTALGVNYDEFGGSRRSLRLDSSSNRASFFGGPTKRKSRFGLTSLFSKKQPERNVMQENVAQQVPSFRRSAGSDGLDDSMTNGGYGSTSRHSALSASTSAAPGARMSVTSRKALEELVAQDSDFVAYRYPSNDQHLDLLR